MPTLSDLTVKVGIDAGGWTKGLQSISGDLKDIDKEFKGIERSLSGFEKIGDRFQGIGQSLTVGVTAPIVGLGAVAANLAGDFEGSFNKIKALGDNITGPALERLRAQAMQLGADTKFSAQQAADGMALFASAGFNADQIYAVMPGTLSLAAAGMTDIGTAAEITKNTLNQFHMEASGASHVADVLAQASADSSANMGQLGLTLNYVGAPAKNAGQSLEETVAAVVALDQAGIQGEKSGTGLRGVIASLVAPSKDAQKELAALEISLSDNEGRMRPLSDIMEQFKGKLSKIHDETERSRIVTEIFGREAGNSAQILIDKGGPALDQLEGKLINSQGAAKRMADTMNQGLNYSLEQLKGSVETAGIALGTALLPVVGSIIDKGTKLVNEFLMPAIKWFGDLPQPVQGVGIALAAVAAAAGPVLYGIGTFMTAIGPVTAALTTMGTAAGAAAGTGAIGALAAILPIATVAVAGLAAAWAAWKFQDDLPGLILLKKTIGFLHAEYSTLFSVVRGLISTMKDSKQPTIDATKALGDMNAKAKPLHEQMGVVIKSSKDLNKEFPELTTNTDKHTKKTKELKDETHKLTEKNGPLAAALKMLQEDFDKAKTASDNYKARLFLGRVETVDFNKVTDDLVEIVGNADKSIGDLSNITLPPFIQRMNDITPPTNAIKDALKTLGIEGSADLQKVADKAAEARDVVLGSNLATDFEKKTAVYKALKAQVDAAVAAGRDIPAEQAAMLTKMETELKIGKGKDVVTASSGMFAQVSTIITNFAQDAANVLFNGELSWGEKVKKLWGNLQQSLVSTFIEPATQVLTDFIDGVLKDLITGKGFGGVLGQISKIGTELKDVFGAGGVANPTPTPTTAPGGGGPGGAGGASSAASGVMGIVGAIGSVATAVSSIIGNFQMFGMNKSLDVIVQHTLQTANDLANLRRDEWEREGHLMLKLDDIWRTIGTGFSNQFTRLGELYDLIDLTSNAFLDRIARAVEPAAAGAAGMASGGLTVNFNNVTFRDRSDIDYALSQLSRNYR